MPPDAPPREPWLTRAARGFPLLLGGWVLGLGCGGGVVAVGMVSASWLVYVPPLVLGVSLGFARPSWAIGAVLALGPWDAAVAAAFTASWLAARFARSVPKLGASGKGAAGAARS